MLTRLWVKAGLFFATKIGKWVLIGLAVAALLGLVYASVCSVQNWQVTTYNKGFTAGSSMQEARWQGIASRNAAAKLEQVVFDAKQSNQSVRNYLTDIAAREPRIVRVKEETIRYAQTDAGRARCLDDNGVRLILQGREALGIGGHPGPAPGTSSPVRDPVRVEPPAAPVQRGPSDEAAVHDEGAGRGQPDGGGPGSEGVRAEAEGPPRFVAPERPPSRPRLIARLTSWLPF